VSEKNVNSRRSRKLNKAVRSIGVLLCLFGFTFLINIKYIPDVDEDLLHDGIYIHQGLRLNTSPDREFVGIIRNKTDKDIIIESLRYTLRYTSGNTTFYLDPPQFLYNITVPANGEYIVRINASGLLSRFTHGSFGAAIVEGKPWYMRVSEDGDFDKINYDFLILGILLFIPGFGILAYPLFMRYIKKDSRYI
jgi:hypothetical protein